MGVLGQGAAMRRLAVAVLLGAAALGGCAGDRPVFLPPEPPRRPSGIAGAEGALGAAAQREHQRLLAAFGGEYRAPGAKAVISEVVAKLASRPGSRPTTTR